MTGWQDLRVARETTWVDRVRPAARAAMRYPAHLGVALALALTGVVAAASDEASVVERCEAAAEQCPRFTSAHATERARMQSRCLAPFATGGAAEEVTRTRLGSLGPDPVLVAALTPADDGGEVEARIVTATPSGSRSVTTPSAGNSAAEPTLTLSTGSTWVFPDLAAVDRWLDDRDEAVLDARRLSGGVIGTMAASRLGRVSAPADAPAIEVSLRAAESNGVLLDGRLDEETERRDVRRSKRFDLYPVARVGETQLVTRDHRDSAQDETRVSTLYTAPASSGSGVAGSGVLTVVSRRGDDGGQRVTGLEIVHLAHREGTKSRSAEDVLDRHRGTTLVTTVRVAVDATNREDLAPWLREVEAGLGTGEIVLPPNLTDPQSPEDADPVQNALYQSATVLREYTDVTDLHAEAAVMAWAGLDEGTTEVPEQGEHGEYEVRGFQLMDRSADGVRRVERPLTCLDVVS